VQHERIGIGAKFRDYEGNPLNHQASDEGVVTRESIKLGDNYRALGLSGQGEGGCKLLAAIQGVRAARWQRSPRCRQDHNR
jgi:hypothetical protein